MIKILLIRHAMTDAAGKKLSGRLACLPLNNEGRQQAQALANRLKGYPVSAIYSSPLDRARETAEYIAEALNLTYLMSDDFMEFDFGKWTNRVIDELKDDDTFRRFNVFRSSTRAPEGELMAEAQLRIVTGLEKLHHLYPGKTIAVVGHADIIKSALLYYLGMPLDFIHRLEISPASVSILELYDDSARISLLNDTGLFEP
jgi:probable phosphoglycerate mutase